MRLQAFRLCLIWGLASAGMLWGQMAPQGVIIKEEGSLVWVDLGQTHGIVDGDLFDIVAAEKLVHPVTDSVLAITQKAIGAIRVRQVWEKMSLAQLLYIRPGDSAMLKQVVRIKDAERQLEIKKFGDGWMGGEPVAAVSSLAALVPGLYQIQNGATAKGWTLLGAETLSMVLALAYRIDSNDWYETYNNLPAGLTEERYSFYFDGARDRRNWSNRFLWFGGALFAFNLIDNIWMSDHRSLSAKSYESRSFRLEVSTDPIGHSRLMLVHRF